MRVSFHHRVNTKSTKIGWNNLMRRHGGLLVRGVGGLLFGECDQDALIAGQWRGAGVSYR